MHFYDAQSKAHELRGSRIPCRIRESMGKWEIINTRYEPKTGLLAKLFEEERGGKMVQGRRV